jgi:hypothetical protein
VVTNSPIMLNVDCDMFANNPQVALRAMCLLLGFHDDVHSGFVRCHRSSTAPSRTILLATRCRFYSRYVQYRSLRPRSVILGLIPGLPFLQYFL